MRHPVVEDAPIEEKRILHKDFSPEGAVVGYIDGHPIREFIVDNDGRRYSYVGVAPRRSDGGYDMTSLRNGEWLVADGLVYS